MRKPVTAVRRPVTAAVALALLASGLSACSSKDMDVPAVVANTESHVAMSPTRFTEVQKSIFSSVAAADESRDGAKLAARVTGPMLTIREAQYRVKNILADSYALTALSSNASGTAISSNAAFPRLALSIMAPVQGANLQTIDVFAQPSARENWKLWANLVILPGATVPGVTSGSGGAQIVDADNAEGLAASPSAAMAAYVNLNQTRSDAQGLTFADDRLRNAIAHSQDTNAAAVSGVGTASMSYAADESGVRAFRTDDGGALVFGQMNYEAAISVPSGRKVTISTSQGKIAAGSPDGSTVLDGQTMTAKNAVIVGIYVPPANAADTTLKVVAASESAIVSVTIAPN